MRKIKTMQAWISEIDMAREYFATMSPRECAKQLLEVGMQSPLFGAALYTVSGVVRVFCVVSI